MDIVEFFASQPTHVYSDWASILGLVISLITLVIVRALRRHAPFRIRIDEHTKALSDSAGDLAGLLQSYDGNKPEIDDLLALINVKLRMIERSASSNLLSDIRTAKRDIRSFRWRLRFGLAPKENLARLIYTDINVVAEELKNVKTDLLVGNL